MDRDTRSDAKKSVNSEGKQSPSDKVARASATG